MPELFNNVWAVTESELVPAFYNSAKTLRKQIERDAKKDGYGLKRLQLGGNGRKMLVSFDSLPAATQDAIGDPRKHNHILEVFYKTDKETIEFYTTHKINGEYLKLQFQEEYITNASVLKACVKLKAAREHERKTKKGSMVGIMATIVKDAHSFNKTLQVKHGVQHTLQTSERWFKDAFKAFYNDGKGWQYSAIISKKHGNANAQKVTDDVVKLLNDMFAGTDRKPTRSEISRQYNAFLNGYLEVLKEDGTGECYDNTVFKPLSDNTIITYLGSWGERIGTYSKRSGDRQKLMQDFKPYHSLDMPTYAGSIISIDDRQPPFKYADGQRPWFYNGIDLASEAFTCWVYGKSKDGIILDFYRQMIRNYTEWGFHLPAELEAESSLNSSFKGTFLREGAMFSHVRIEANNARGKRIEAYYKPLRYQLEKERTGWLARPFALSESNQAGNQPVPMIPYSQIIEGCLADIQTWNNMPHSVHKTKSRWEVFCERQHPELKPTNWKSFLPWLGFKEETSCNAGIIKLQKKEFLLGDDSQVYLGENLIGLMKQVEGRNIDVYWLDDNNGGVLKAIVFIGDQCICEAVPKPRYNRATIERTPDQDAARELMSAYVATIEAYMRRKAASIDRVLIIDNRQKTLNNKFVMPGLKVAAKNDYDPEALPNIDDDDFMMPSISATPNRSLVNRF